MVNWTRKAERDLDNIFDYISLTNPDAAKKVVAGILKSVSNIESSSFIGKVFNPLFEDTVREIIHNNYRIFYEIQESEGITVLSILHVKQLI